MPHFEIASRISQLRQRLVAENVDAFIAATSTNIEYLTGFDSIRDNENPHAVLVTPTEARFLTDSRYLEVAQAQAATGNSSQNPASLFLWTIDDPKEKLVFKDMHEMWDLKRFKTIALEDTISHRLFEAIKDSVAPVSVVAAKNWVEDIRTVKDAAEIARITAAQDITDSVFALLCDFIKPGVTEKEVAVEIEYRIRMLGAQSTSFPPIVAAGPNGSLPHAVPSDRPISAGDLVTIDFGASYGGYCSDMTRTVFVSNAEKTLAPSQKQKEVYDTVLAAQTASLETFKTGATGIEVDKAARDVIEKAGYGQYFGHGTGHGVGLEIHELPNASPRSPESLKAGEVVTCEPGIYLPGELGVRIEDIVVVNAQGASNITKSPKELLVI